VLRDNTKLHKFRNELIVCETWCSADTLETVSQITRGHIPEDGTFHFHRCENSKAINNTEFVRILSLLLSFLKIKVGLCDLHAVCVSVYAPHY
jgi:hypothetical protein